MALVHNDMTDTGTVLAKMNDFEAAVSFIITHDPVVSKKNKISLADISTTDREASNTIGAQVSSSLVKPSKAREVLSSGLQDTKITEPFKKTEGRVP